MEYSYFLFVFCLEMAARQAVKAVTSPPFGVRQGFARNGISGIKATVLGGQGFVGRYYMDQLGTTCRYETTYLFVLLQFLVNYLIS